MDDVLSVEEIEKLYPDIQIQIFFEPSEEDEEEERGVSIGEREEDRCDYPVTKEDIESDMAKIEQALLQQPFRSSEKEGYQKMVEENPSNEWKLLCSKEGCGLEHLQSDILDPMIPGLVKG